MAHNVGFPFSLFHVPVIDTDQDLDPEPDLVNHTSPDPEPDQDQDPGPDPDPDLDLDLVPERLLACVGTLDLKGLDDFTHSSNR